MLCLPVLATDLIMRPTFPIPLLRLLTLPIRSPALRHLQLFLKAALFLRPTVEDQTTAQEAFLVVSWEEVLHQEEVPRREVLAGALEAFLVVWWEEVLHQEEVPRREVLVGALTLEAFLAEEVLQAEVLASKAFSAA
jgi:hypothetical protein